MSQFLVEVYLSQPSSGTGSPGPDDVSSAADHLTRHGRPVRLLCSVFVPEDETGLYLFEAQFPEVVVEVAARCGLRFERLVEARARMDLSTSHFDDHKGTTMRFTEWLRVLAAPMGRRSVRLRRKLLGRLSEARHGMSGTRNPSALSLGLAIHLF
jgi:hypothetical protein